MKKVIIVGAGSGGISVASRLLNLNEKLKIVIIDPASDHFYLHFFVIV